MAYASTAHRAAWLVGLKPIRPSHSIHGSRENGEFKPRFLNLRMTLVSWDPIVKCLGDYQSNPLAEDVVFGASYATDACNDDKSLFRNHAPEKPANMCVRSGVIRDNRWRNQSQQRSPITQNSKHLPHPLAPHFTPGFSRFGFGSRSGVNNLGPEKTAADAASDQTIQQMVVTIRAGFPFLDFPSTRRVCQRDRIFGFKMLCEHPMELR